MLWILLEQVLRFELERTRSLYFRQVIWAATLFQWMFISMTHTLCFCPYIRQCNFITTSHLLFLCGWLASWHSIHSVEPLLFAISLNTHCPLIRWRHHFMFSWLSYRSIMFWKCVFKSSKLADTCRSLVVWSLFIFTQIPSIIEHFPVGFLSFPFRLFSWTCFILWQVMYILQRCLRWFYTSFLHGWIISIISTQHS